MSLQESREFQKIPESGNIIEVDPSHLMEDNPAALIVNKESYQRMEAHFSPLQLDPPQVVWVKTFSKEHEEERRLFVVDGLTRTKFAADHKETILPDYPQFSFDTLKVRDVTASNLRNTAIVPVEERDESENALTMLQYLRAVVPPTAEHSEIVADRIAAHLINGWDNMVGDELAEKFSALAALDYLVQGPLGKAPLQDRLKRQQQLVVEETIEDRITLENGLSEMASILEEAHLTLRKKEVLQSAFILVSAGAPVIGGDRQAFRQVYGMLSTPEIDRKIADAASEIGQRDEKRRQLGFMLVDALNKFSRSRDRYTIMDAIATSLRDPSLSLQQVDNITLSDYPLEQYRRTKEKVNKDKVSAIYSATHKKEELTSTEEQLIHQLAGRVNLDESEIPTIIRSVHTAQDVIQKAEKVSEQFGKEKDALRISGVSLHTLQEAGSRLSELEKEILSAESTQAIYRKVKELQRTITAVEGNITREVNVFKVEGIVRSIYGEESQEGYGPLVRKQVVEYLLREVDPADEGAVGDRLQQLYSLDPAFQSRVIDPRENMRIETALRLQKQRAQPVSQPAVEAEKKEHVFLGEAEEHVILDKRAAEEVRVRTNNESLVNALQTLRLNLGQLDLEPTEVFSVTRKELDSTLRVLGKLRFGHPDIVRAVNEQQAQVTRDIHAGRERIHREQETAAKDTRTRH